MAKAICCYYVAKLYKVQGLKGDVQCRLDFTYLLALQHFSICGKFKPFWWCITALWFVTNESNPVCQYLQMVIKLDLSVLSHLSLINCNLNKYMYFH